jgi:effector-binding domain-containing protein
VWTIDYYNEDVRLEIEALPAGIRASYARLTELLEEFGLELRMPRRELDIARARQKEVCKP